MEADKFIDSNVIKRYIEGLQQKRKQLENRIKAIDKELSDIASFADLKTTRRGLPERKAPDVTKEGVEKNREFWRGMR